MAEAQILTFEQLQTPDGVNKLNDILRELYKKGRESSFLYTISGSKSADTYGDFGNTTTSSTIGIYMPTKGSIVQHSCLLNITTATSDSIEAQVRVNDTEKDTLSLSFPSTLGTGVTSKVIEADRHAVSFSKGDLIQIYFDEVGTSGTMVWQDTIGFIKVIFDNE